MNKHFWKYLFIYLFKGAVVGLTLTCVFAIVLWNLPRDPFALTMVTDEQRYSAGDTIKVTNTFEVNFEGKSDYATRLICRNGTERRVLLREFENISSIPNSGTNVVEYTTPRLVGAEHTCVIAVRSSHTYSFAPFLSKTVFEVHESNEFSIR